MQKLISENLQEEVTKYPNFRNQLQVALQYFSSSLLPSLFNSVIHFDLFYRMEVVMQSGYYCTVYLEFIRYLAEGQNEPMQKFIGEVLKGWRFDKDRLECWKTC
jgi:hypothetical protein